MDRVLLVDGNSIMNRAFFGSRFLQIVKANTPMPYMASLISSLEL